MTSIDERPDVWIGHVDLPTTDVEKSRDCLLKLGCRPIADLDGISILELRGGTHLILEPAGHEITINSTHASGKPV